MEIHSEKNLKEKQQSKHHWNLNIMVKTKDKKSICNAFNSVFTEMGI